MIAYRVLSEDNGQPTAVVLALGVTRTAEGIEFEQLIVEHHPNRERYDPPLAGGPQEFLLAKRVGLEPERVLLDWPPLQPGRYDTTTRHDIPFASR